MHRFILLNDKLNFFVNVYTHVLDPFLVATLFFLLNTRLQKLTQREIGTYSTY